MRAAVGDGSRWGLAVTYIDQPEPLGLAHAVLTAADFVRGQPFLMYLGDNVLLEGVTAFVREFERVRPDAQIFVTQVAEPEHFGVVVLEGDRVGAPGREAEILRIGSGARRRVPVRRLDPGGVRDPLALVAGRVRDHRGDPVAHRSGSDRPGPHARRLVEGHREARGPARGQPHVARCARAQGGGRRRRSLDVGRSGDGRSGGDGHGVDPDGTGRDRPRLPGGTVVHRSRRVARGGVQGARQHDPRQHPDGGLRGHRRGCARGVDPRAQRGGAAHRRRLRTGWSSATRAASRWTRCGSRSTRGPPSTRDARVSGCTRRRWHVMFLRPCRTTGSSRGTSMSRGSGERRAGSRVGAEPLGACVADPHRGSRSGVVAVRRAATSSGSRPERSRDRDELPAATHTLARRRARGARPRVRHDAGDGAPSRPAVATRVRAQAADAAAVIVPSEATRTDLLAHRRRRRHARPCGRRRNRCGRASRRRADRGRRAARRRRIDGPDIAFLGGLSRGRTSSGWWRPSGSSTTATSRS